MAATLRSADFPDAAFIQEVLADYLERPVESREVLDRLEYLRATSNDQLFICESDRAPAGILATRLRENIEEVSRFLEVSLIVVAKSHRKQGIGRAMMNFARAMATERRCIGLWLVSGLGTERESHGFYERLGFQVTGHRFVQRF